MYRSQRVDKGDLLDRGKIGEIQDNLGKTFKQVDALQMLGEDGKSVETNKDPREVVEDESLEDNKHKLQSLEDEVLKLK